MKYLDGRLVDGVPCIVPPKDVLGVFSTIGCDRGIPLLWPRHRARLQDSLSALAAGSEVLLPGGEQLGNLIESEGLQNLPARIRLVLWIASKGRLRVEACAAAAGPVGPDQAPATLDVVRWSTPPDPALKWVSREPWHEARRIAQLRGRDDALLVDGQGRVLEASIANVFVRFGATFVTPAAPEMCLPGIMREWVIDNVDVTVGEICLESLMGADEVWVTNAVAGIVRVGAVGRRVWRKWDAYGDLVRMGIPAPGWPAAIVETTS